MNCSLIRRFSEGEKVCGSQARKLLGEEHIDFLLFPS